MWLHGKKEKKALLITTCVCVCVCGVGGWVWVCMWICAFVCVFFLFFLFTFYVLVCSLLGWLLQCQFTLEPWAALKKKIIIINKIPQYQFTLEPQRLGNKKKIVNKIPQCQLMSGSENKNKKIFLFSYTEALPPTKNLTQHRPRHYYHIFMRWCGFSEEEDTCMSNEEEDTLLNTDRDPMITSPSIGAGSGITKVPPPPLTLHHRLSAFALILRRH